MFTKSKTAKRGKLVALALTLTALAPATAAIAAEGDPVIANPGTFTANITGGTVSLGAISQPVAGGTMQISLDSNGNYTAAASTIQFNPISITYSGQTIVVKVIPTNDATGQLDASDGRMSMRLRFKAHLTSDSAIVNLGSNCILGTDSSPLDMNKALTSSSGGSAYDTKTGNVTLANNSYVVPAFASGTCGGLTDTINKGLGLESPAGLNYFNVTLNIPGVESGGGKISSFESGPEVTSSIGGGKTEYYYRSSSSTFAVAVGVESRQSLKRRKYIGFYMQCTHDCLSDAKAKFTGTKKLKRKSAKVTDVESIDQNEAYGKIKLTSSLRKQILRAVKQGKKPKVKLTITARNGDSKTTTRTRYIRLY